MKILRRLLAFSLLLSPMAKGELHSKTILVTGGTGYIGSHVSIALLEAGYAVVIVDNNSNSKADVAHRIEEITRKKITHFYKNDLTSEPKALDRIFKAHNIYAVIHLAGLKSVRESTEDPLRYYHENLVSSMNLLASMKKSGTSRIIFSSSATVYGNPVKLPIDEDTHLGAINPYGRTKQIIEYLLEDIAKSNSSFNAIALRYFNPIGAHKSGRIGEDPEGVPNNLMPYILDVVNGKQEFLTVFTGYKTPDGSGVRDYIHVMDLAEGHLAALNKMEQGSVGYRAYNLGTGKGFSTLEIVAAANRVLGPGHELKTQIKGRRPGDVDTLVAAPQRAEQELRWHTKRSLDDMVRDSLNWARSRH